MDEEFNLGDAVVARLARQIADLVVQLAVKDAQIEELTARLTVQQSVTD